MKIKEIGHLAFTCADLEKSIEFYRDKLGFRNKFCISYADYLQHLKENGGDENYMAYLETVKHKTWIAYFEMGGGQFVELFDRGNATVPCVPTGEHLNYSHVALLVEDIHEAHRELLEKGVPIDTPPKLGLEGTWQMWSHDPDGNKIEFMQYTERSWQLTGR